MIQYREPVVIICVLNPGSTKGFNVHVQPVSRQKFDGRDGHKTHAVGFASAGHNGERSLERLAGNRLVLDMVGIG